MEDCCVVCAEPLEWVGYGVCGHRDVCSTCIARMRFVLDDKKCCICKQDCPSVIMTKALGDFTRVVKDFTSLGTQTNFWHESNTNLYFDDKDHFERIKAMCHLSCQICEQTEASLTLRASAKKSSVFESLDQLRQHLMNAHKLQMCTLCLKGRKIFISEQKLYNNAQLARHLATGDSEVDGVGEGRGGFVGHPICEFCQVRYYGDNELYQHMSVDHFTCHICQRLNPGQYAYFHKYDDLEAHFRHEHALCEHPDCLAKKFIVFTSEADLKRHTVLSHGGNMSRSQRNAALKIPVSFQYRRPIRDHGPTLNSSLSVGSASSADAHHNIVDQSTAEFITTLDHTSFGNRGTEVFAQLGESSSSSSLGGSGTTGLEDSAFPPLPGSKNARRKAKQIQGSSVSMASVLSGRNLRVSTNASDRMTIGLSRNKVSGNQRPMKINCEQVATVHSTGTKHSSSSVSGKGQLQSNIASSVIDESHAQKAVTMKISDEVRAANKALIEHIQSRFIDDKDLFSMFKEVSTKFRKGEIDASLYYNYTASFGLEDLVPELARLCPDTAKRTDLLEAFEKGQKCKPKERFENNATPVHIPEPSNNESSTIMSGTGRLTDRGGTNAINVELASKDGHMDNKGKNKAEQRSMPWSHVASSSESRPRKAPIKDMGLNHFPLLVGQNTRGFEPWSCGICTLKNIGQDSVCAACGIQRTFAASEVTDAICNNPENSTPLPDSQVHGKKKKRVPKFERARLGDGLSALSLMSEQSDSNVIVQGLSTSAQQVCGRGAWRNMGGQKLLTQAQKETIIQAAWRKISSAIMKQCTGFM